ncbi:MAG: bifunctional nuclease family protein [Acidimicrobiia bacterium]
MSDEQQDNEIEKIEFCGIRIEVPSNQPMLLFKRLDSNVYLPITIGMPEATSIMFVLQGVELPRPLTHDLFVSSLQESHLRVSKVHISQVVGGTYYAEITFLGLSGEFMLSARPSDAVALSVRMKEPVLFTANSDLFEFGGIELDADNAEEEIEQFRDFLDEVTPDDFQ